MALRLGAHRFLLQQTRCRLQQQFVIGTSQFAWLPSQRIPTCSMPFPSTSSRTFEQRALFYSSAVRFEEKKSKWPYHLTMTEEEKKHKEERIKEMQLETPPEGLFAKFKFYFKRYWYIAVPAHAICCVSWFVTLYGVVYSGVDVVQLLHTLHMPDVLIDKVQHLPESAGAVVIALVLYKIATPLRYMTTLVLIRVAFWMLKRMGKLRTAREVEYTARTQYEINKKLYGRRLYRYRYMGVHASAKKSSVDQAHAEAVKNATKETQTAAAVGKPPVNGANKKE